MAGYLDLLYRIGDVERLRKERKLRDRCNPMELFDEDEFPLRFRCRRHCEDEILPMIYQKLEAATERNYPASPILMCLIRS